MTSPSGIFVPAPHAPRRLAGPDFIRLWLVIQPRRCPRDFPGRREAPFCPCHRACCSWTYLFFLWFVFLFVHRYLSFTCRVCSFAQPVPTSSSRRPSRRNARQARRLYSFKACGLESASHTRFEENVASSTPRRMAVEAK